MIVFHKLGVAFVLAILLIGQGAAAPVEPSAEDGWFTISSDSFARPDTVPRKEANSSTAVGNGWIDSGGGAAKIQDQYLRFVRGGFLARSAAEAALDQRIVVRFIPGINQPVFARLRSDRYARSAYMSAVQVSKERGTLVLYGMNPGTFRHIGPAHFFTPVASAAYTLDFRAEGGRPTRLTALVTNVATGATVATAAFEDDDIELQAPGVAGVSVLGGVVDIQSISTLARRPLKHVAPDGLALTGPAAGEVGVSSDRFTVTLTPFGAVPTTPVTVAPADSRAGGSFFPASVTLTVENPTASFFYTPAKAGIARITASASGVPAHAGGNGHAIEAGVPLAYAATPAYRVSALAGAVAWSPYTWLERDGAMETVNDGAYFKLACASTAIEVDLDLTPYRDVDPANWPKVGWSIDGGEVQGAAVPANGRVVIANGLAPEKHTLFFYVRHMMPAINRWHEPKNRVRVTAMKLDDGVKLQPPPTRPHNMFLLWDSIGYECEGDSNKNFVVPFAKIMDSEVGRNTNGGEGYTVDGFDVPPAETAWPFCYEGASRLVRGKLNPPPDYIVIGHGTNDFLRKTKDADLSTSVAKILTALRAAAPAAKLMVVVPFGGFNREAITAGFHAYQTQTADKAAYLIDLGPAAQAGIDRCGVATSHAADGLHPSAAWAAELGRMLGDAARQAVK
jgi:lysophospholipase L1-like esterase